MLCSAPLISRYGFDICLELRGYIVAQNKISYILDSTAISYLGNVLINALFATKKRMKLRPQTKYEIYFVCTAHINFIYLLAL